MRQLKFRAFDGKSIYYGGFNIHAGGKLQLECFIPKDVSYSIKVMQFTGLQDKNGKDIYEGDFVEWVNPDTNEKDSGSIEWDETFAGFGITGEHCLDWNHMLTVIGNIHQNPELLNKD